MTILIVSLVGAVRAVDAALHDVVLSLCFITIYVHTYHVLYNTSTSVELSVNFNLLGIQIMAQKLLPFAIISRNPSPPTMAEAKSWSTYMTIFIPLLLVIGMVGF